jgi:hypothetical protein
MLRRYKAVLLFVGGLLLLVLMSLFMTSWLAQEKWLFQGYAWIDWLHDVGRSYMQILDAGGSEHLLLCLLFPLLFTLLILSVLNIVVITILIFGRRWLALRNLTYSTRMTEKVDAALMEYLFGNQELARENLAVLNQSIVIKEIVSLYKQTLGSKSESLKSLFDELELDRLVIRRIRFSRWFTKITYIDAAQSMLVYHAEDIITPYQYGPNPYVRNVAQVACINLSTGNAFSFLNVLEDTLPVWHQIILHKAMVRNSIPLPDFYEYLRSENDTVVLFALNMIRLFDQTGPEEEVIALVSHMNPVVRRNALRVIRDLKIYSAIEIIKQRFHNETLRNQVGMVHALSLDKPQETFDFYKNIWMETPSNVRMEILKHVGPSLKRMLQADIS